MLSSGHGHGGGTSKQQLSRRVHGLSTGQGYGKNMEVTGGCWNVGQRLRVVGSGYGQDTLHTCMKLTKNIFKAKNSKKEF